jgi:hypothetical protein
MGDEVKRPRLNLSNKKFRLFGSICRNFTAETS